MELAIRPMVAMRSVSSSFCWASRRSSRVRMNDALASQFVFAARIQRIVEISFSQRANGRDQFFERERITAEDNESQHALPQQGQYSKSDKAAIESAEMRGGLVIRFQNAQSYGLVRARSQRHGCAQISFVSKLKLVR